MKITDGCERTVKNNDNNFASDFKTVPLSYNKFFKFVTDYFNFLRKIKFNFENESDRILTSKWIWSKEKKYLVPDSMEKELKNLQFDYNNRVGFNQILNINYTIDEWFTMVREFIVFLDTMELSSLYKNDKGESNLYVTCDAPNSSYIIYYYDDNKDTEYRLSFIDTDIPKPNQQSAIMSFINAVDDDEEETTITLVQIDILRRYGDKRTNQLKLVSNADNNKHFLNKEEDNLLFNVFRDILSQVIFNTFHDILNNVNKIVGFERNITEEVLHGYIKLSEK